MKGGKKYLFFAAAAAVGIALDQFTKWIAVTHLTVEADISVIRGFFSLTLRYNTGAAFSLLASKPTLFFLGISAVAIVALLYFVRQLDPRQKAQLIALGTILGGALGNLADRIRIGRVVDFLHVYYKSFDWPAFNVADSLIVVGVFTFLWYNLRQEKRKKQAP